MKNLKNLQQAISRGAGKAEAAQPPRTTAKPAATAKPEERQGSRVGQINLSAWVDPQYKTSLRLVQAQTDNTIQNLVQEALNDLFAKYNVPTVRQESNS